MKHIACIVLLILFLAACRKDVKLDIPNYQQKVVIEGGIDAGSYALVYLSYSVPYFGDFDYTAPQESFIKGALVTISNGVITETLTEVVPSLGYVYDSYKIVGEYGKTYTIRVTVNDKTFETSTTIQEPIHLDSLYFQLAYGDSLGFILQKFSEPAGSGDAYRWYAKRLHRDEYFAAPFNSVFDDKFVDGKTFEFGYDRGPQPNQLQQNRDDPERGYYKIGDTVVVKFCRIGRREYDFWSTYYQNKLSNSNPFSSPSNIKSMFTDHENAFGAFIGYAPAYDTIVIKKP